MLPLIVLGRAGGGPTYAYIPGYCMCNSNTVDKFSNGPLCSPIRPLITKDTHLPIARFAVTNKSPFQTMRNYTLTWGILLICTLLPSSYSFIFPSSDVPAANHALNDRNSGVSRRASSFWDVIFFGMQCILLSFHFLKSHLTHFVHLYTVVIGDHCPPGPIGKKCRDEKAALEAQQRQQDANNNASNDSQNDSSNDSQNDSSNDSQNDSSNDSNDGSSSSSASSLSSSPSAHYITSNKSRILTLTLACVAGSVALAAVILGTRRAMRVTHHPLHGVLNQRVQLFQKLNGSSSLRGPRIILEDDEHHNAQGTHYQLA
jgi:hypothetical protein